MSAFAFLLLIASQQSAAADGAESSWIYYDWLDERGRLRGGRVAADASDPLHGPGPDAGAPAADGTGAVTLLASGPPSNRLDLVFVGDGYTAAQLGTYAAHVNAIWPVVLAEHPLDDYASYVNVHRVDVVSNQSGVDNDPVQGIQKDTALDMTFWCSGIERLLCVNVAKASAKAALAPESDHVLAIANSAKYGGAGYSANELATLAGNNGASIEIALHELGHSLGNLADEYDYDGPATYTGPEPAERNASIHAEAEMASLGAKWSAWLSEPNVATFEGAMYSKFGIYRPTVNSKMRNLDRPFEQVNAEQLVLELYRIVDPIDDATPPGTYLADALLFVDPLDPVHHALDVQWLLDGAPIGGATALTLVPAALGLAPGLYEIGARVTDNTPLVRDEALRQQIMTEERSWTVIVPSDPQPPLVSQVTGGGFIADLPAVAIAGAFLDTVTAVRIGGVTAAIETQAFDSLTAALSTSAAAPGWLDVEVEGPGGTTLLPDAAPIGPTLAASTTGIGGTLDVTLELGKPSVATFAVAVAAGVYPTPLALPPIHYGLVLNLAAAFQVPDFGFLLGSISRSYPVPDQPSLSGATLYLQAYASLWEEPATSSFSGAASVTF